MSKTECFSPLELDRLIAIKLNSLGYDVDARTVAQWRGSYNTLLSEKDKDKIIDATDKDKYVIKKINPKTGLEEEEATTDVVNTLLEYNIKLQAEQVERETSSATIDAKRLVKLKDSYKGQEYTTIIRWRTAFIRNLLESRIDAAIEYYKTRKGITLTREDVLLGAYTDDGRLRGGTGFSNLIKWCFVEISGRIKDNKILGYDSFKGDTYEAKELAKLVQLDNWPAFVALVRDGLKKDYPNVKLSRVELTEDNDWYEYDSDVDTEELTRDGITRKSETSDFFKSASAKTRRILRWLNASHKRSELYAAKNRNDAFLPNGTTISLFLLNADYLLSSRLPNYGGLYDIVSNLAKAATDDIGEATEFEDEQDTHSMLSNTIFRGIRNAEDMFNALQKYCLDYVKDCIAVGTSKHPAKDIDRIRRSYDPTIFMLYAKLLELKTSDPAAVTAFAVDFTKSTNRYGKTTLPDTIRKIVGKLTTLNENRRDNTSAYLLNAMTGRYADDKTVYSTEGSINIGRLIRFKTEFIEGFGTLNENEPTIDTLGLQGKVSAIANVLRSLGFLIGKGWEGIEFLFSMSRNSIDFARIIKELKDLADYGFRNVLPTKIKTFEDLVKVKNGADDSTIKDSLDKIQRILNKYTTTRGSVLPSAKVKDSQGKNQLYSTLVQPSYLSEMYNTIQHFINDDADGDITAKERFKEFISQEYLCSRFFYYDPKYIDESGEVNPVIEELVRNGQYQYKREYILNRTLRDWWDACNSSLPLYMSIGSQQDNVFRELLIGDNAFENAFTKELALSMITHFGNNNDFVYKKQFISEVDFLDRLSSRENHLLQTKLYIIEGTNYQFVYKPGIHLMEMTSDLELEISRIPILEGSMQEDFELALRTGDLPKNSTLKPNTYYSYNGKLYRFIQGWRLVPRTKYQAPVFILGDSNISKYTIETAYSKEEILRELMNVSMLEIQRDKNIEALMQLDDEDLKPYVDTGIIPRTYLDTYRKEELRDRWFILPMLNGVIDKEASPSKKEGAIRQALEKGFLAYKENLRKSGLLKFKEGMYVYLEDFIKKAEGMTKEEALDKFLELQYYNHVFHMIEQLLLLTFDPAMYANTTDLLKRFKEVHASGAKLDLDAVWIRPDGSTERVFRNGENTTQSCLYFRDVSKNSEKTNPDLMLAMVYQYSVDKANFDEQKVRLYIAEDNLEELKKLMGKNYSKYKKYRRNTLTDGQGYRMLDSYRAIKIGLGLWLNTDEKAYRKILELQAKGYTCLEDIIEKEPEVLDELIQYGARFQPLKPFTFTHERIFLTEDSNTQSMANSAHMAVQHKYAEVVLIPCLLPRNSELRNMALMCRDLGVSMICSDKCVKVGASNIICLNDEDLGDKGFKKGVLETYMRRPEEWRKLKGKMQRLVHKLPLRDFRIQNNITEHNEESLFGTLVRKLALGGIRIYDEYGLYSEKDYSGYVTGKPMVISSSDGKINLGYDTVDRFRGKELMEFYNGLVVANMLDAMSTVKEILGNIDETSEMLLENALHNDRSVMDALNFYMLTNDDTGIKQFVVPLFDQILEHDTTALLLSTFKKKVNKQKINGGSAVQASALFTHKLDSSDLLFVTSRDKRNILYAETEVPWNFVFINKSQLLDFNKYCNPDGTLKLSDEKSHRPEVYTDNELFQSYKNELGKWCIPLIELDYPGILDILAYRIPTERDYSMMRLRIVRFSLPVEGGIIKVPVEGTTRSGFDFDIDKLYMMKYQYKVGKRKFSKQERNDIWDAFFSTELGKIIRKAIKDLRNSSNFEKLKRLQDFVEGKISEEDFEKLGKERLSFEDAWDEVTKELSIDLSMKKAFEIGREKLGYEEVEEILSKYDLSKSPLENSVAARNNMLVSIIMARQEDPETFDMRLTPGGFVNLSRSASFMRVLKTSSLEVDEALLSSKETALNKLIENNERPEYDYSDPWTMIVYNQLNQIAAKLVGIFANLNSNVRLCSLMKRLELVKPIAFCDKSLSDLLHYNGTDGVDPELTIAELLAASVDAVKDPILNDLNINTITANTACLLGRLGYSTDEIALLFNLPIIRAVCDYMFDNNITDLSLGMKGFFKHIKAANPNILSGITSTYDLLFEQNELGISETALLEMTRKKLIENIRRGVRSTEEKASDWTTDEEFLVALFGILHEFIKMSRAANSLNSLVASSKFTSSNGVGSTIGDLYELQMRTEKFNNAFEVNDYGNLSNGVFIIESSPESEKAIIDTSKELALIDISTNEGKEKYFRIVISDPFAYEQCMYDMNRLLLNQLNSSYYPYDSETYSNVRQALLQFSKYGLLSARVINTALCDLESYILALQRGSVFDEEATVEQDILSGCLNYLSNEEKKNWDIYNSDSELLPNNREFFLKYFPRILCRIIRELDRVSRNSENPFLLKNSNGDILNTWILTSSLGEKGNLIDEFFNFYYDELDENNKTLLFNVSLGLVTYKGSTANLFNSILTNCKPWLLKALFLYNFYKDGYEFGVDSYINRISFSMLDAISIEIEENEQVKKLSYSEFLGRLLSKNNSIGSINTTDFIMQEILNHPDFDVFTYTPKAELLDDYRKLVLNDEYEYVKEFEISVAKEGNILPYSELLTTNVEEIDELKFTCVMPCINIDGHLYMVERREGTTNPTIPDKNGKVRYRLVSHLGKTAKTQRWLNDGDVWELKSPTENQIQELQSDEDKQNEGQDPETMLFIYEGEYENDVNNITSAVELKGYSISEDNVITIVLELLLSYVQNNTVVSLVYEDGQIKVKKVCKG